jgi:hypothetical protein
VKTQQLLLEQDLPEVQPDGPQVINFCQTGTEQDHYLLNTTIISSCPEPLALKFV